MTCSHYSVSQIACQIHLMNLDVATHGGGRYDGQLETAPRFKGIGAHLVATMNASRLMHLFFMHVNIPESAQI